jgi:hypothetical protein
MEDALLREVDDDEAVKSLGRGVGKTVGVGGGGPLGGLQAPPPPAAAAARPEGGKDGHQQKKQEQEGTPLTRPNARFWAMACSFTLSWFTLSWPGFTSPVIAGVEDCEAEPPSCPGCLDCELNLSSHGTSMFITIPGFIGLGVALLVGPLIDRFGRKPGVVLGNAVTVCGW